MSTRSVITHDNLPTSEAMSQYMSTASIELLKKLRFEIGCPDHERYRNMLRLSRFICDQPCYIDSDESREIREQVIKNAITEIYEL